MSVWLLLIPLALMAIGLLVVYRQELRLRQITNSIAVQQARAEAELHIATQATIGRMYQAARQSQRYRD